MHSIVAIDSHSAVRITASTLTGERAAVDRVFAANQVCVVAVDKVRVIRLGEAVLNHGRVRFRVSWLCGTREAAGLDVFGAS